MEKSVKWKTRLNEKISSMEKSVKWKKCGLNR